MIDDESAIDIAIGSAVRDVRRVAGLASSRCAARLSLPEEAYAAREDGRERFRARELFELAQMMQVPIGRFMVGVRDTVRATAGE